MLREGTALSLFSNVYQVADQLGRGSEGTVYSVVDRYGVARYALKWYHADAADPARWDDLRQLADRGAPASGFLWPLAVIKSDDGTQFGYVMDLRPDDYVGVGAVLNGRVAWTLRMMTAAGAGLARGLHALHAAGLCYRDLSMGNVFVQQSSGRVLICDNDNVGIDGSSRTSVAGTRGFMAPEIVRGTALPSSASDRYSLAVLLFYLLLIGHPLEGVRTEQGLADDDAYLRFYGTEPIFCLAPDDDRNRPDPEIHAHLPGRWVALPWSIQRLFIQSFTSGLRDPGLRVRDSVWLDTLTTLGDSLLVCPQCDEEYYFDPERPGRACPWAWCGAPRERPVLALTFRGVDHPVMATPGAGVGGYHASLDLRDTRLLGRVVANSRQPDQVGLRNESDATWMCSPPAGEPHLLPPSATVPLAPGLHIDLSEAHTTVVSIG